MDSFLVDGYSMLDAGGCFTQRDLCICMFPLLEIHVSRFLFSALTSFFLFFCFFFFFVTWSDKTEWLAQLIFVYVEVLFIETA